MCVCQLACSQSVGQYNSAECRLIINAIFSRSCKTQVWILKSSYHFYSFLQKLRFGLKKAEFHYRSYLNDSESKIRIISSLISYLFHCSPSSIRCDSSAYYKRLEIGWKLSFERGVTTVFLSYN